MATQLTLEQRLWAKIDRRGPDECWPWLASSDRGGYGHIGHGGRVLRATRVVYAVTHPDESMDGLLVLHSCDNPPCCNPAHLRLGTHADNAADKIARGRQYAGARHRSAKLTCEKVVEIRCRLEAGATLAQLGREHGVRFQSIQAIANGRTWRTCQPEQIAA